MNPLTILLLVFGWLFLICKGSNEAVQTSQATREQNVKRASREDKQTNLANEDLEQSISSKLRTAEGYAQKCENYIDDEMSRIFGPGVVRIDPCYNDAKDSMLLRVEMAKRGKVPKYELVLHIQNTDIAKAFSPRLNDEQSVAVLRWYESLIRRNGGYGATLKNVTSVNGLGAWYFDGASTSWFAVQNRGSRLW